MRQNMDILSTFCEILIQSMHPCQNYVRVHQATVWADLHTYGQTFIQWARALPSHRQHYVALAIAEGNARLGYRAKAMDDYDLAISVAQENQCIEDEALANKLASQFYFAWGKIKIARVYRDDASACYRQRNASATSTLDSMLADSSLDTIATASFLDSKTLVWVAQAITRQVTVEGVVTAAMTAALTHSGAKSGALILANQGNLGVAMHCAETSLYYPQPLSLETWSTKLPIVLIRDAFRTGERIDHWRVSAMHRNPYLRTGENVDHWLLTSIYCEDYLELCKPKSFLCLPIFHKGQPMGVLYLENADVEGLFNNDNIQILHTICSQATISLENARLYEVIESNSHNLDRMIQERTKLLHMALQSQKLTAGYLHKSLRQFSDFKYALDKSAIVAIVDTQGIITYVNEKLCQFFKHLKSEIVGKNYRTFRPEEHFDQSLDLLFSTVSGGCVWQGELHYKAKDNTSFWLDTIIVPFLETIGTPYQYLAICRDISDRIQAEHNLKSLNRQLELRVQQYTADLVRSRKMFQLIIDALPQRIFWKDRNSCFLGCNRLFAKDFGLVSPLDIMDQKNFDLPLAKTHALPSHTDDTEIMKHDRSKINVEEQYTKEDGTVTWFRTTKIPLKNDAGAIVGLLGSYEDITEHKKNEEKIRDQEEFLRSIYEGAEVPIFVVDVLKDGNFRPKEMNPAAERLSGMHSSAFSGKSLQEIYGPIEGEKLKEDFTKCLERGTTVVYEECRKFESKTFWSLTTLNPLRDHNGNIYRLIGTGTDITARKETEIQLQYINDQLSLSNLELERVTRLKDEFLASMSHELRTPLNAILGISEGLLEGISGPLTPQQSKSLNTIEKSGRHLLELINDILDLSKIEAGQLNLYFTTVSLQQLCNDSLVYIQPSADQKKINLNINMSDKTEVVDVDERRIRQVFINLLSNAVKFTPEGGSISIDVKFLPSQNIVCIKFIDTGIGISPQNIEKLFQAFVQIDSQLNRQYSGTGLGLVLVKRIVELHQGSITVESQVGQGSCFTVQLPWEPHKSMDNFVSRPNPLETASGIAEIPSHIRPLVLIAEDNEDNIETFSMYLESFGYEIACALNGIEAVHLAKTLRPRLILIDIQMPQMDGLEAIRQIRMDPNAKTIPIIALTALAMPDDRSKCMEAGANEYLSKPVRLKELRSVMQNLLTQS